MSSDNVHRLKGTDRKLTTPIDRRSGIQVILAGCTQICLFAITSKDYQAARTLIRPCTAKEVEIGLTKYDMIDQIQLETLDRTR